MSLGKLKIFILFATVGFLTSGSYFLFTSIFNGSNPEKPRMFLILVEDKIWNDGTSKGLIKDFSNKVSRIYGYHSEIEPISNRETAHDIADKLSDLYFNGKSSLTNTYYLGGTTLIGDINLPIMSDDTSSFVSVFPYGDFVDPAFSYDETTGTYISDGSNFGKLESFVTLIKGNTDEINNKLTSYIESDDIKSASNIIISNLPQASPSTTTRLGYDKRMFYTLERMYYRYSQRLLDSINESSTSSGMHIDIMSLPIINNLLPNLSSIFSGPLNIYRANLEGNITWSDDKIYTPEYLIDRNDKLAESILKKTQDGIKEEVKKIFERGAKPISVLEKATINSSSNVGNSFGEYFGNIYGKQVSNISSITECTLYNGDFPTIQEPYNQKVENNVAYNLNKIEDSCDGLSGCCGRNLRFDQSGSPVNNQCRPESATKPIYDNQGTKLVNSATELRYPDNLENLCKNIQMTPNRNLGGYFPTSIDNSFDHAYDNLLSKIYVGNQFIKPKQNQTNSSTGNNETYNFKLLSSFISKEEPTSETFQAQTQSEKPPFALPITGQNRAEFFNYSNTKLTIPYLSWFDGRKFDESQTSQIISNYITYLNNIILESNKAIIYLAWVNATYTDSKEISKVIYGDKSQDSIYKNEFETLWQTYISKITETGITPIEYFIDSNPNTEAETILGISPYEILSKDNYKLAYIVNGQTTLEDLNLEKELPILPFLKPNHFDTIVNDQTTNIIYESRIWHNLKLEEKYKYIHENLRFINLPSSERSNILLVNPLKGEDKNFIYPYNTTYTKTVENTSNQIPIFEEESDKSYNSCLKQIKPNGTVPLMKWMKAISCWASTLGYTKETDADKQENTPTGAENIDNQNTESQTSQAEAITQFEEINQNIDDARPQGTTPNLGIKFEAPETTKLLWDDKSIDKSNADLTIFSDNEETMNNLLSGNSFGQAFWHNSPIENVEGSSKDLDMQTLFGLSSGKVFINEAGKSSLNFDIEITDKTRLIVSTKENPETPIARFALDTLFTPKDLPIIEGYLNTPYIPEINLDKFTITIKDLEDNILSTLTQNLQQDNDINFEVNVDGGTNPLITIISNDDTIGILLSYPLGFLNWNVEEVNPSTSEFSIDYNGFDTLIVNKNAQDIIEKDRQISSSHMQFIHMMGQGFQYGKAMTLIQRPISDIFLGNPALAFATNEELKSQQKFGDYIGETRFQIEKFISLKDDILGLTGNTFHYIISFDENKNKYFSTEFSGDKFDTNLTVGINDNSSINTPGVLSYKNDSYQYFTFDAQNLKIVKYETDLFNNIPQDEPIKILSTDIDNDNSDDLIVEYEDSISIYYGPDFIQSTLFPSIKADLGEGYDFYIDTYDIDENDNIDIIIRSDEKKIIQKQTSPRIFEKTIEDLQSLISQDELNQSIEDSNAFTEKFQPLPGEENKLPPAVEDIYKQSKEKLFEDVNGNFIPDIIEISKTNSSVDTLAKHNTTEMTKTSLFEVANAEDQTYDMNFNDSQVFPYADELETTTREIENFLKNMCKGSSCFPIPFNIAFLTPGYINTLIPTPNGFITRQVGASIPGFPIGFPIFGMPGPLPGTAQVFCIGPSCQFGSPPSTFRLYITPTLTGGVAVSICTGEYNSMVNSQQSSLFGGNCFVIPIPLSLIPGVSDMCSELENNLNELLEKASSSVSTAGGMISASINFSGQSNTKLTPKKRPGEFPAFMQYLMDTLENLINAIADLPDLYILLPNLDKFTTKNDGKVSQILAPKELKKVGINIDRKNRPSDLEKVYNFMSSIPFLKIKQQTIRVKIPDIDKNILKDTLISLLQIFADLEACIRNVENAANGVKSSEAEQAANSNSPDVQEALQSLGDDYENLQITGQCPADTKVLERAVLQTLKNAERELKQYIKTLSAWLKFLDEFDKYANAVYYYIGQVIDNLNKVVEIMNNWIVKNTQIARAWSRLPLEIKEKMETIQALINLSIKYNENCNTCTNERYSGSNWYFDIIQQLIAPALPKITFPTWPDVELDLSNLDFQLEIVIPKIKIDLVKIELPNIGNLALQLPNLDALNFNLDDLPQPPELPELPDLNIQLPVVKLPYLPPAPEIPDIGGSINGVIKIIEKLMDFWCLLKKGYSPVAEKELKNVIEFMTARSGINPIIDFSVQFPTQVFSSDKKVIRLMASADLTNLPIISTLGKTLIDQLNDFVKEWNTAIEFLAKYPNNSVEKYKESLLLSQNDYETINIDLSKPIEKTEFKNISPYLYDTIAMIKSLRDENSNEIAKFESRQNKVIADIYGHSTNATFASDQSSTTSPDRLNFDTGGNTIFMKDADDQLFIYDSNLFPNGDITISEDLDHNGKKDVFFLKDNFIYAIRR